MFYLNPVIFQTCEKSVSVIDLPASITAAQSFIGDYIFKRGRDPRDEPFPSTEPKSERARANVLTRFPEKPVDLVYRRLIQDSLRNLDVRHYYLQAPKDVDVKILDSKLIRPVPSRTIRAGQLEQNTDPFEVFVLYGEQDDGSVTELERVAKANISSSLSTSHHARVQYLIPKNSSFFISYIDEAAVHKFSAAAIRNLPPTRTAGIGQFDLILLDPPWENRSVKRSGPYETARKTSPLEVFEDVLSTHMAPSAIVACWITNNDKSRNQAMKVFEAWDVALIGELVWLKVTTKGVPMYDVNGIWRRPYEILLLGRKKDFQGASTSSGDEIIPNSQLERRLVVAIPDLHSQKPRLEKLIEPLLVDCSSYRALEIFARNLAAGWWSWGEDVLKYNAVHYWSTGTDDSIGAC